MSRMLRDRAFERMIDPGASEAAVVEGMLFAFGGERGPTTKGIGARAYGSDGRRRFHVLGDDYVYKLYVSGGHAYAVDLDDAVAVVELATGRVVRRVAPPWIWVDLIVHP